jgi:hypothetical protein
MMTAQLEVSILAAPVAAIDPRTLSQAWYSALRLGQLASPDSVMRNHANGTQALSNRSTAQAASQALRSRQGDRLRVAAEQPKRRAVAGSDSWSNAVRYRAARTHLAERIERAFAGPNARPKRATFSMGRGRARVVVILQTSGKRSMLLALCRPELRAMVARALAQARCALAARGVAVEPAGDCECS